MTDLSDYRISVFSIVCIALSFFVSVISGIIGMIKTAALMKKTYLTSLNIANLAFFINILFALIIIIMILTFLFGKSLSFTEYPEKLFVDPFRNVIGTIFFFLPLVLFIISMFAMPTTRDSTNDALHNIVRKCVIAGIISNLFMLIGFITLCYVLGTDTIDALFHPRSNLHKLFYGLDSDE